VVDGRERSSAVKLRLVTFGIPESQLDDCPYSRPTDVLNQHILASIFAVNPGRVGEVISSIKKALDE